MSCGHLNEFRTVDAENCSLAADGARNSSAHGLRASFELSRSAELSCRYYCTRYVICLEKASDEHKRHACAPTRACYNSKSREAGASQHFLPATRRRRPGRTALPTYWLAYRGSAPASAPARLRDFEPTAQRLPFSGDEPACRGTVSTAGAMSLFDARII